MAKGIILESSSSSALIAEIENNQIKQHQYIFSKRDLSNQFFAFLKALKNDISFIGVGIGPGAYTGVRVSLTIAKAFAYALNIPIVSFSSLKSFIPETDGEFLSILDAKIGGVYVLRAQRLQDELHFSKPTLYSIDEVTSLLSTIPKIISPHIEVLKKRIPVSTDVEWILGKPNTKMLAKICFNKFSTKDFTLINNLNPIYLRDA